MSTYLTVGGKTASLICIWGEVSDSYLPEILSLKDMTLLANIIHLCILQYYASSNLQSVVAAFSCNTFAYPFVTLSPTVSGYGTIVHSKNCDVNKITR